VQTADDSRAHRIADNAHSLFARRYLSPAAGACYWRSALHAYVELLLLTVEQTLTCVQQASVQRFEPEIRDAKPYAELLVAAPRFGAQFDRDRSILTNTPYG
jgi:hypothetical protein